MDATTAKRKRSATDIAADESASAAATAVEEVSDAEVEEFYAILRRMRDASRRLCGVGARPPVRAPAWRPSFSWEDFAPAAPSPAAPAPPRADDERAARDDAATKPPRAGGLDLNVVPEPDTPSSASAPAPAPSTPRSARAQS